MNRHASTSIFYRQKEDSLWVKQENYEICTALRREHNFFRRLYTGEQVLSAAEAWSWNPVIYHSHNEDWTQQHKTVWTQFWIALPRADFYSVRLLRLFRLPKIPKTGIACPSSIFGLPASRFDLVMATDGDRFELSLGDTWVERQALKGFMRHLRTL